MFDTKPVDISELLTVDVDLSELYIDVDDIEGHDQTCSKESPVDMTVSYTHLTLPTILLV